ncbi:DUF2628 domain-containing protein [Aestuariivirga sp.]|uniref:DUF2628 domain-containing protein n=1 Tax=Aestuariivirga sp. TaxID=2650926 RepID=UPI00391B2E6F
MALFDVFEPPDGKLERVKFLPEGFSIGAFIFTVLWALWQRMWVVAALLFAGSAALTVPVSLGLLQPALGTLLQFTMALIFGFEARRLQALSLEKAGFRHSGLIEASRLEAAELAYFAKRVPSSPAAPEARFRGAPEDTLGIFGNV